MRPDTVDPEVVIFVFGLALGFVFGIPCGYAIRSRHRRRHRTRSLRSDAFSGASLLMSKIDVEPIEKILPRYDAATGVDDAARREPDALAAVEGAPKKDVANSTLP
jgi:hypothetical protein